MVSQLEDCINFIISIGGANVKGISGETLLSAYVTDVLLVRPEHWNEVSTATIRQQVHLKHLQALFVLLEDQVEEKKRRC